MLIFIKYTKKHKNENHHSAHQISSPAAPAGATLRGATPTCTAPCTAPGAASALALALTLSRELDDVEVISEGLRNGTSEEHNACALEDGDKEVELSEHCDFARRGAQKGPGG